MHDHYPLTSTFVELYLSSEANLVKIDKFWCSVTGSAILIRYEISRVIWRLLLAYNLTSPSIGLREQWSHLPLISNSCTYAETTYHVEVAAVHHRFYALQCLQQHASSQHEQGIRTWIAQTNPRVHWSTNNVPPKYIICQKPPGAKKDWVDRNGVCQCADHRWLTMCK